MNTNKGWLIEGDRMKNRVRVRFLLDLQEPFHLSIDVVRILDL